MLTLLEENKGGVEMGCSHECTCYWVALINDKETLQLIWEQMPADLWLEMLISFWKDHNEMNPDKLNQDEIFGKLVVEVDELLDDVEEEFETSGYDLIDYIFAHPKWQVIEGYARMI